MKKIINLKKGIFVSFKQNPVLSVLSLVCTIYITSLLALAIIETVYPQGDVGSVIIDKFL